MDAYLEQKQHEVARQAAASNWAHTVQIGQTKANTAGSIRSLATRKEDNQGRPERSDIS